MCAVEREKDHIARLLSRIHSTSVVSVQLAREQVPSTLTEGFVHRDQALARCVGSQSSMFLFSPSALRISSSILTLVWLPVGYFDFPIVWIVAGEPRCDS
jgi:hypothetical protein